MLLDVDPGSDFGNSVDLFVGLFVSELDFGDVC